MRKGPLNSYVDPTEFGAGSAILEVSEAAKASGKYDPWADVGGDGEDKEEEIKDGMETVGKAKVKVSLILASRPPSPAGRNRTRSNNGASPRNVIQPSRASAHRAHTKSERGGREKGQRGGEVDGC